MNSTVIWGSDISRTKRSSPPDRARLFYAGAAALLLVLMFVGFQQFYLHGRAFPNRPLTPAIRTLLITHGIAMSLWLMLLLVQPLLVVNRKFWMHMMLGRAGAVLAAFIFVVGLALTLEWARIDLRNQLALFDRRIEVGVNRLNGSADVTADLHRDHGIHGAGSGDRAQDRSLGNLGGDDFGRS